jgi:hypothetical protein
VRGLGVGRQTVTKHFAVLEAANLVEPGSQLSFALEPRDEQVKLTVVHDHFLNNPAQQPDPSVTVYCNEVPLGHACHAVTAAPGDPNESPQRNCDTNIVANANTSCGFAENAFYEYYGAHSGSGKGASVMVHSPTTGKNYELGCGPSKGLIGCVSSPTSDGIYVSFPEAAIDEYTEAQARAYDSTRDVGHPGKPAANDSTASEPSGDENSSTPEAASTEGDESESSIEDEVGSYSHSGDQAFCSEHECIGEFENEDGYVAECSDGTFSHSGGKSGACSDHGGERRR